jgi:hypothetical protein
MTFDLSHVANYEHGSIVIATEHQAGAELGVAKLFRLACTIEMKADFSSTLKIFEDIVGSPILKTKPVNQKLFLYFSDFVISFERYVKPYESKLRSMPLGLIGDIDKVESVYKEFKARYTPNKESTITWFYEADKKVKSTVLDLPHKHEARDEYYPFIKGGLEDFQKRYLENSANILLLMGPPGCGKTSFVRDMIRRNSLSSAVTYDENLLNMDSFFIELVEGRHDLLVIEDADTILRERKDGNKLMSKLLNAGDGLIQTKKKLVFTTNISHVDEIDHALIRPGRCFDILHFRDLKFKEAAIAAKAAGLPEPDGDKSLSQLFQDGPAVGKAARFGFDMSGNS